DQRTVSICKGAPVWATTCPRFADMVRKSPEPLATNATPTESVAGEIARQPSGRWPTDEQPESNGTVQASKSVRIDLTGVWEGQRRAVNAAHSTAEWWTGIRV